MSGKTIHEKAEYRSAIRSRKLIKQAYVCLLYTSDAADDLLCVDLGGRRTMKKKNTSQQQFRGVQPKKITEPNTSEQTFHTGRL